MDFNHIIAPSAAGGYNESKGRTGGTRNWLVLQNNIPAGIERDLLIGHNSEIIFLKIHLH